MTILEAIDSLNSWVRSDSARDWHMAHPRYAIYDWKHEYIDRALKAGTCEYRAVHLMLNCRDCAGSGRYIDSYGYKFDHCRKCSNSGRTRLTFLETTIEGVRWHTPWDKVWRFRLPEETYGAATLSMDWEPNQKGKELECWQVAEALNVLETQMPIKHGKTQLYDCGDWYGDRDHAKYKLYLGRTPRICEFCSKPAVQTDERGYYDGVHHGVSRGLVGWSAWACNDCKGLYATMNRWSDELHKYVPDGGNGKSIFDEFKMPMYLCEHPEIRAWLARRGYHL